MHELLMSLRKNDQSPSRKDSVVLLTVAARLYGHASHHIKHRIFKGIPTALEQDAYFHVNKRNLIIFNDQMIDAGKDQRIVNLFTRGSHHRNLSVI